MSTGPDSEKRWFKNVIYIFKEPMMDRSMHDPTNINKRRNRVCSRRGLMSIAAMIALALAVGRSVEGVSLPDLAVQELWITQTEQSADESGVTPRVTVNFLVTNLGAATSETFTTTIAGIGNTVNITTSSIDGNPSIGSNETLYFTRTLDAPISRDFTVTVTANTGANGFPEVNRSNNSARQTSNILRPPVNQWVSIGPRKVQNDRTGGNTGRLLEVAFRSSLPQILYTRGEE